MEIAIVVIIVLVLVMLGARSLYRTLTGKDEACPYASPSCKTCKGASGKESTGSPETQQEKHE